LALLLLLLILIHGLLKDHLPGRYSCTCPNWCWLFGCSLLESMLSVAKLLFLLLLCAAVLSSSAGAGSDPGRGGLLL